MSLSSALVGHKNPKIALKFSLNSSLKKLLGIFSKK